jgi:aminocarboxymuconate-semialdehyde decarboxylase
VKGKVLIPAIDMHAHFWPKRFLESMQNGTEWFGWKKIGNVDSKTVLQIQNDVLTFKLPKTDLVDPAARSKTRISTQGVTLEAPMVVGFLWNYHLDFDDSIAFCREVNEELSEVQHAYPDNYHGLAILPAQNNKAALQELRYAVDTLGLTSFSMASHVNGSNLDEQEVLEIIEEIAKENLSLSIHPEFFNKIGDKDRLMRHYFKSSIGAPAETSVAMLSLIYSGIFDRYPDFKVSFTQGGGFAPYSIGRNGVRWSLDSVENRATKLSPEKYLKNCYVDCLVHDDLSFGFLLERLGPKNILIGTDYPFDWDHPGGSANWIRGMEHLSLEVRKDLLWNTASGFLGSKVPYREI